MTACGNPVWILSSEGRGYWDFFSTESQDGWGWKRALEVIWSNISAQAASTTAACPELYADNLNVSKYEEMTQPNWATCSVTLTGEFLPYVQTVPPVFQFVPIASGPVSEHHRKEPGSSSVHSSFRHSYSLTGFLAEATLLQAEHAQLCSFPHRGDPPVPTSSLQPLLDFPLYLSHEGQPTTGHRVSGPASPALSGVEGLPPRTRW